MSITLYGLSSSGKILFWDISTEGASYFVRFGQLGSDKFQTKETKCSPKNEGRANATTAEEQARIEAEARVVKQRKKGYYDTKEEALNHVEFTPMKLQRWDEQSKKISYPCYVQTKLNGMRCMIAPSGAAQSKSGEEVALPTHIQKDITALKEECERCGVPFLGLDGEIYAGNRYREGLSLQDVISAFRKPNANTPKLQYHVYDVPDSTAEFRDRNLRMHSLKAVAACLELESIVFTSTVMALDVNDVDRLFFEACAAREEGIVIRNFIGMYEFGKRSYDALKRKPVQSTEARVLGVSIDKNNWGVLHCVLRDGVLFKCQMRVDADPDVNYRLYENAVTLVDKFIEIEYEEKSKDRVPLKPIGVRLRDVDPNTWEAKE